MNTKKAIVVTVAMTSMIVVILGCLLALRHHVAFYAIAGAFAISGLVSAAVKFCYWLMDRPEDEDLEPVVVADPEQEEEDVTDIVMDTVDQILAESHED